MHTPGPWMTADWHSGRVVNRDGVSVAITCGSNARLIAAAPDLLAALQFAMENLELANPIVEHAGHVTSIPSAIRKASAAIAKATA